MWACGAIAATRRCRLAALLVGTFEIGISNSVVMPPAAAAAVPDANVSRSSTPGYRVCTCGIDDAGQDVQALRVDHALGARASRP